MTDPLRLPHVVIVGAGFGGLACARSLADEPVRVTLVDRENFFLFTPLLYQVASCLLNPSEIGLPLRHVFRDADNVTVRRARVTGIDFDAHTAMLDDGTALSYDRIVVATGSETSHFGNAGAAAHTLGLKTLGDALLLRNHILDCLERATSATEAERRHLLTFCVVGGGPTGVEFAGALSELVRLLLPDEYPEIHGSQIRIMVLEGGDRLLAPFHPSLSRYTQRELVAKGVEVHTNTLVDEVTATSLTTSRGMTVETATVVWTAGVKAVGPGRAKRLPGKNGRWDVDAQLRIVGVPDAYAIGDLAGAPYRDGQVPMQSPGAMQGGRYVARMLLAEANGAPSSKPFRYRSKGSMATIGRSAAVAQIGPLRFRGLIGWVMWLFVHIFYLLGVHNRIQVFARWAWHYVHWDRPVRLIVAAAPEPSARRTGLPPTL